MRCVTRMGLGVLGLALAAPAATWAGLPVNISRSTPARPSAPAARPVADGGAINHAPTIDPASLKMMEEAAGAVPPPPGTMTEGGAAECVACQAQVGSTIIMGSGDAPGYAVSGGPMMAPGRGLPVAGGQGPFGEPAPIGVMQAGYRPAMPGAAGPMLGSAMAPGRAVATDLSEARAPYPYAGPLPQPHHRRSSVMLHVLGLGGGRHRTEEHEREARSAHAAISYGSNAHSATDLPASMVFGR